MKKSQKKGVPTKREFIYINWYGVDDGFKKQGGKEMNNSSRELIVWVEN